MIGVSEFMHNLHPCERQRTAEMLMLPHSPYSTNMIGASSGFGRNKKGNRGLRCLISA